MKCKVFSSVPSSNHFFLLLFGWSPSSFYIVIYTCIIGYVVQGSNGEYAYLTPEERVELVKKVVEWVGDKKLIIAGTGCECKYGPFTYTNAPVVETAVISFYILFLWYVYHIPQCTIYLIFIYIHEVHTSNETNVHFRVENKM